MKRLALTLLALLAGVLPAAAQWQIPQYAIPIGKGPGVTGFNVAAPGTTGMPLVSAGAAANPIFGTASVAGGGTGRTSLTAFNLLVGNGTGAVALVAPSVSGQMLLDQGAAANPAYVAMSGDATLAGSGAMTIANLAVSTAKIAANAVDNTKLRQSSALCLVGRAVNSTGNVADICATAGTGYVMHESSSTLEFGQLGGGALANNIISTAHLQANAVTYPKLAANVGQIPGTRNYFMGGAGNSSVTGSDNTGFGGGVFAALTTGTENAIFGCNSTAANAVSGGTITTSKNNTIMGCGAGVALTTQAAGALGFNTLIGYGAGMWLLSGTGSVQEVTALGVNACNGLTTGGSNTCIGSNAMQGYYLPSPPTGTATTGSGNTAVGYNTASWLTTASNSTYLGTNAGNSFTTGGANVIIGANTLTGDYNPAPTPTGTAQTGSKITAVGYGITGVKSGTYTSLLGAEIVNCGTALSNATVIGARVNCATVLDNEVHLASGAGTVRAMWTPSGLLKMSGYAEADVLYTDSSGNVAGASGTTTTVLHGNASGSPSFGAVSLTADVTGTLPSTNGGTGANLSAGAAGGVPYFASTGVMGAVAAGTSGQVLTSGGAATPTWSTIAGSTIATKTEMETATSTTVVVTPGRAQYHPGTSKAWAKVSVAAGATLGTNLNITSVGYTTTGVTTVNFTTAFASATSYICTGTTDSPQVVLGYSRTSASQITVTTRNIAGAADIDQGYSVVCFGGQ
jgi:hypothetical protein